MSEPQSLHEPSTPPPLERLELWHRAAAAGIMALFALVSILSSLPKAPSGDTLIHYGYGEQILGAPFDSEIQFARHGTAPVSALFVLSCRAREALTPVLGSPFDPFTFPGIDFTIPSVLWSFMPVLAMALLVLGLIWIFATLCGGPTAGLLALALAALEPNMIAHSHFATTDMASTLGFFGGCVAIALYVAQPTWKKGVVLALVLAVAQVLKLPNLILYPCAVLLAGVSWWLNRPTPFPWKTHLITGFVSGPIAFVAMLHFAYGFTDDKTLTAMLASSPHKELLAHYAPLWHALRPVIPPLHSYTVAYAQFFNSQGNWSYLAGDYRQFGWWYYYLAAMALKMPLPLLAAALVGLVLFAVRGRRSVALWCLVLPAGAYLFYFSIFVNGHVGVRHVLPIFPAMFVLGGLALYRTSKMMPRMRHLPSAAVLGLMAVGDVAVFPHYEEYFNIAAGGSNNGWRWLGDSNIDFGQDHNIAVKWASSQGVPVTVDPLAPTSGLILMRATMLIGHTPEMTSQTAWLRNNFEPVGNVTPGLLIYNVSPEKLAKVAGP